MEGSTSGALQDLPVLSTKIRASGPNVKVSPTTCPIAAPAVLQVSRIV